MDDLFAISRLDGKLSGMPVSDETRLTGLLQSEIVSCSVHVHIHARTCRVEFYGRENGRTDY